MIAAPLAVGLLALSAPAPAGRAADAPPLMVSVALPRVHGQRQLPLGGSFTVVVTNVSEKPVRVWRDWCSWGHNNLSLGFEDGDTEVFVERNPREWGKNYPDAAELAAGESILFPVNLTEKEWTDLSRIKNRAGRQVKMRVRYHIPADAETAKLGVWTGTVHTPYQEYSPAVTK